VPYNSKFFKDKPERKDTGTYVMTAINKWGQDTAEVEVIVVIVVCKTSSFLCHHFIRKYKREIAFTLFDGRIHKIFCCNVSFQQIRETGRTIGGERCALNILL